jgi:preprotein translocase subunit SecA
MFKNLLNKIFGDPNRKAIEKLLPRVAEVNGLEAELSALTDDGLRARTQELREEVTAVLSENPDLTPTEQNQLLQQTLDEILPSAYALVREASRRTTGLRHYDVQIMGGVLLHQSEIVEMRTGEGKTLVATLPLFLNALSGRGVHLVTVNDYLVRRDGGWMGKIFHFLGLTVAAIGPQQFSALYDPEYINPGAELEDERLVHWRPCTRREAYRADITYGTSSEFGFDYLRDNMAYDEAGLVQRSLYFAVIDEVDNVLIDEARTPLIISGPAQEASDEYRRFSGLVKGLRRNTVEEEDEEPDGHYDIDEKSRSITLTSIGVAEIERRIPEIDDEAGESLYDPQYYQMTYYLENALKAEYLFKRDIDYTVQGGEVIIIDDFTGRLMPGRRYSDGLHEAIEAKENVQIQRESITVATITIQNYFRLYQKIAGMTGTAMTDAEEFQEIYKVEVTPLPTNVTYMAEFDPAKPLELRKEKRDGVEVTVYAARGETTPRYFKRIDFADQVFATEELKDQAIINEIINVHQTGRPVLVGTTSVEHSEKIDKLLQRAKIPHKVLNAKIHDSEALIVAQAGRRNAVTISTNMAGRGTDILLGGNPEGLAAEYVENKLFNREAAIQLAQTFLQEGEEKARAMASRHGKLSPALVDQMVAIQQEYQTASVEIEKVQIAGYVARLFTERYGLDYADAVAIIQEVQTNRLNRARVRVTELGRDTVMVDEAVRLFKLHLMITRWG